MSNGKWIVKDTDRDAERQFDDRAAAEEALKELKDIVASSGGDARDVQLIPPDDSSNTTDVDVKDHTADAQPAEAEAETDGGAVPEPSELTSDPLDVISSNADQFTDTIKGKTVINRQGYAVLAERFDISVTSEPVTLPSETEFEYAEFRAVAETEAQAHTGFGSAHVDRGDDATLLGELAETRAMKRATAWATGVGMTAVSELQNEL